VPDGGTDLAAAVEQVARLGAPLLLQSALEAEVTAFLGQDRYERAAGSETARDGMRNGYCPVTVKTTSGPGDAAAAEAARHDGEVRLGPVRDRGDQDQRAGGAGHRRVRPRPVGPGREAALAEALGPEAAVSKSTVSRICKEIKEQYEAWRGRRLDDVELDYLFLDASFFKYHANAAAEPVLAAWGITTEGKPVFIGLDAAAGESTTRGMGSCATWASAAWPARCWSSPTARPG
jgi:putative transposase